MEKRYKPRKQMKVAVLRENLYKLTGEDAISAMILNQLIYWSDIMDKSDQQTREAIEAFQKSGDHETAKKLQSQLKHGWFWKSANQLSKEIMIASRPTVTKRLKELEKKGFIESEAADSYDKPKHYRVNLPFVKQELRKLGYTLDGYIEVDLEEEKIDKSEEENTSEDISEEQEESTNPVPTEQGEHTDPVPAEQGGCSHRTGGVPTEQGVFPQNRGGVPTEQGVFPQNNLKDYKQDYSYEQNTDKITQQQQEEKEIDPVVVVQNLIKSSFEKELKEKEVQTLLKLANNDIDKLKRDIKTAFQYNSHPDSLMALLRYVVTSWDYSSKKKQEEKKEEEMPKVFQQEENNDNSSSEIPKVDPEARARIMNQLQHMRQRFNKRMQEKGGNLK